MRGASLVVLLAVLGPAIPNQPLTAQPRNAVPPGASARISRAEDNEDGSVLIEFENGRSIRVPPEKGQPGLEKLQVALSGRAVGWLVADHPVGSYSVPTTLTVYTVGKPLRHFGDGLMLIDWTFIDDDKHIQFSSSQAHGRGTDWRIVEVHDVETSRLLERWLEPSDTAPADVTLATVKGLVTDARGVPLPNTVVSILPERAPESIALTTFALTTSAANGSFTLRGVWPGEHELQFEHPHSEKRTIKITIGPGMEAIDAGTLALERQPAREK